MPCLKQIDLSPASVKSSLRALSQNQRPRIPETLLASTILEYWETGSFPAFTLASSEPHLGKEAARASTTSIDTNWSRSMGRFPS